MSRFLGSLRFLHVYCISCFSGLMGDMEYAILSKIFDRSVNNNDFKIDLIGKIYSVYVVTICG